MMRSRVHSVLDDLLYPADQKILLTGLPSLRMADFAWAVEFGVGSEDPGRDVMLLSIEFLVSKVRHSSILGLRNCLQDSLRGLACVGDLSSHIAPDLDFLCVAEARHFYSASAKADIGINERDVKRCSRLIYFV
jgi:hypothetical protein